MAIRVDYKNIDEVSERYGYPLKHSENLRNFKGVGRGYPLPHDTLTLASKAIFMRGEA